jgi:hypothetical protein
MVHFALFVIAACAVLNVLANFNRNKFLKGILMTQEELKALLEAATAKAQKIGTETAALLQKITELLAIIAAGGNVTPEVQAAMDALTAQMQIVDDLVPDEVPPPPAPDAAPVGQ